MANYPKYTLTGKTPATTYESLVQYNAESASLVSADGNDLPQLNITSSLSVSASWAPTIGLTITQSWVDGTQMTQSMYIDKGLIISWSVAS